MSSEPIDLVLSMLDGSGEAGLKDRAEIPDKPQEEPPPLTDRERDLVSLIQARRGVSAHAAEDLVRWLGAQGKLSL